MSNSFAAKINVFVGEVAGGIGLVENFGARAVPIDFAARFLDAIPIAVVGAFTSVEGKNLLPRSRPEERIPL